MSDNTDNTNLVYHYTTQQGFLNIVKLRCIWASKIQYFNDGYELSLGINLVKNVLNSKKKGGVTASAIQAIEELLTSIDKVTASINKFVFSFSHFGDSLSQWRAYSTIGNGLSLGFSEIEIRELAENRGWRLEECVYAPEEQHRSVELLLQKCIERIQSATNKKSTANECAIEIIDVALTLKNKSFEEEGEIRLISPLISELDENVYFRNSSYSILPYYSLSLINEDIHFPLREVFIGPTPYNEIALFSASAYLRKQGIKNFVARNTNSSLRLW